jgi:hypothetical protein
VSGEPELKFLARERLCQIPEVWLGNGRGLVGALGIERKATLKARNITSQLCDVIASLFGHKSKTNLDTTMAYGTQDFS